MPVFRRNPRAVYRVYSEESYLAGGDELGDWSVSPERRVSRDHRLRRLAGVAALTGAVGTVAGVIVAAGVGGRAAGRQIAASGPPQTRAIPPRGAHRTAAVPPASVGHSRPVSRPRVAARRSAPGERSSFRRFKRPVHAASAGSSPRMSASVPVSRANPVESPRALVNGRSPGVSTEAASAAATQSEFGFER